MNRRLKKIIKKRKRQQYYSNSNYQYKDKNKYFSYIMKLFNQILASIIVLLCLLISRNKDSLRFIYDYASKNMNFMKVKRFVDNTLVGIIPNYKRDEFVGSIVINLDNTKDYLNGVLIETDYAEPVLSLVDGIVIRIYEDEEIGKVLVIQDELGREFHYGLLENTEVGMYSIVNKGDILGLGRLNERFNGEFYLAVYYKNDYLDVIDVINEE